MKKNPITPLITLNIAIAGAVLCGGQVAASDSTLRQVIRDIDCSHVTYDTAVDQVNHVDCPRFAPRFERLSLGAHGYPVFFGVYDAAHAVHQPNTNSHDLAVTIGQRRFVLGEHAALQVHGNAWLLDGEAWMRDHPEDSALFDGAAHVQASVASRVAEVDGTVDIKRTTFRVVIPQRVPRKAALPSRPESWQSQSPRTGSLAVTGQNVMAMIALAVGSIAAAIGLLLWYKKRRGG